LQAAGILLLMLSLCACGHGVLYTPWSPATQPGWTQQTGDAAGVGLLARGPEPPLRLRWQQSIGKPPLGAPMFAGPLLLQWSKAPDLFAFDTNSGTRVGKYGSDDPVCGPSAIAGEGGRLLLVSVLGKPSQLRAIDLESGDVIWRQNGSVCAAIVVRGDTVFAALESGQVRAMAVADGSLLWTLALTAPLVEAPSIAGDRLYVADGTGELIAASIDSGRVLWRRDLGTPMRTRPAAHAATGRVFAAVQGGLHALEASTGKVLWQANFAGLPSAELYASSQHVAVGSTDHSLYGFDAATGQQLWRYETDGIIRAAPVGTARSVYFGASDGWLYAVDASDGAMSWRQQLDGAVLVGAALNLQTLAVTTERGTTYLFGTP
jgi:eukaryotic-like serine/threonine-protein kinase